MDFIPPFNEGPGTPYVDDDEALEIDGSIPPAKFFNDIQAELLAVLAAAGIDPDAEDLTQLAQAIQKMIREGGGWKDTNPTFGAGVADGAPVRWDAGASEYVKALADGTAANHAVGIADVTYGEVIFFGKTRAGLFAGLTPGARQYLSGDTAGEMVEAAPDDPVRLGIALSATQMFVDVDTGEAADVAQLPRGYLDGLRLSNNGVDANNDIDVAVGACRDADDAVNMVLGAGLTKRLDAAWAVGTGNGGLFSGAKANSTWYHVFLIRKDDDGTIDAGFDTSVTAANIPAGYSSYRRIGSVWTDGSGNLRAFKQLPGGRFLWAATPGTDYSGSIAGTATAITLAVPTGVKVEVIANVYYSASNAPLDIYSPDRAAQAIDDFLASGPAFAPGSMTDAGTDTAAAQIRAVSNTSGQIMAVSDAAYSVTVKVTTVGWVDFMGRDA